MSTESDFLRLPIPTAVLLAVPCIALIGCFTPPARSGEGNGPGLSALDESVRGSVMERVLEEEVELQKARKMSEEIVREKSEAPIL
ncbi:MAG: hypothetical protein HY587_05190 [Candidatus Omnitrophica bacterium]|nr:hypothetical protein [Candidatus Omnitrophota bacterium]